MSVSMRICTNQEMQELDLSAQKEFLIDSSVLMENAGKSAAEVILERFPHAGKTTEILVFCGKGNNAGDGFVVARHLLNSNRRVRVFHLGDAARYSGTTLKNLQILKQLKAKMTQVETSTDLESFFNSSSRPFTIVDGILGTGLRGDLEGIYYDVVEMINRLNASEVISLDIPSGVSGDTGIVHGTSIIATMTISFGFPKLGHFLPPGAARRGELVNVDISLPPSFRKQGSKFLLTKGPMSALIKERDRYGHKNSFGHTLLIGGSPGRLGAIVMAAGACHRMGTGLVTVATWEDCFDPLLIKLPSETMLMPIQLSGSEGEAYRRSFSGFSSVVVGPGLGMRPEGKQLLEDLLSTYRGPIVIDADALNLVADHKLHDLLAQRRDPIVLTPHPGEMARLLQISKDEIRRDPVTAVRTAVKISTGTVLLKGAATLVGSIDDVLYLNHYPNDGMATAGSGDVLSGMIGGLLGQGMDPFQGTMLGVYLHSLAGDFAARALGHRSMTAPDIIENISDAFKDIKTNITATDSLENRVWLR